MGRDRKKKGVYETKMKNELESKRKKITEKNHKNP